MKRIFYLLLLLIVAVYTYAYDFQAGDFYYNITSSSAPYTVEVTYERESSSSNYSGLTIATIPETVTYNGTTYCVTSIRYSAFQDCSSLTSVIIGNSVKSIEHSAFSGCYSITSIVVDKNNTTYDSRENCNAIIETASHTLIVGCQKTIIPNSVTSIGRKAFYGCSSITSITIPNSVTSIGVYAFRGCSSLTSMTIPNSVTSIENGAFYGCSSLTSVTIPNSVTSIGSSAFARCSSLTSITIPNSVTSIESHTFSGCSSLASVTIPNSVTSIEWYAFEDCSSLNSVTIGNCVTSIGDYAFSGCSSLTSVTIPNCVTSIGDYAFSGCSSLTSVTISNSVTSIGYRTFYGCSSLASVTIPNSVTSIVDYAFEDCSSLTSVTIGNSVTSIGWHAFLGCPSITSIVVDKNNTTYDSRENCNAIIETASNTLIAGCQKTIIPNSVTSIGDYAFYSCSGLTSPIYNAHCFAYMPTSYSGAYAIQDGIKQIAGGAFSKCSELTSITIPNSVTSIGRKAFYGCTNLTDIIWNAKKCSDFSYVKEGWGKYVSEIFEYSKIKSFTFGNDVEYIPAYLCLMMSNLTSVIIPNSVTNIGLRAFAGCSALDTISINATTPPTLGEQALSSVSICYIPMCTQVDYVNSNWNDYVDTFEEHPINVTSGSYGPNINWKYKDSKLSLSGSGNISKLDCTPWELLIDSIKEIEIENGITNIPADAFSNYTKLNKIILPSSLEEIGANAFANCRRLYEIYSYASIPPLAEMSSFTNYNATLYVPCEHKQYYQSDMVFSLFNKVECISSEEVETDSVIVVPGANNVTITWLKEDGAETYSIVIKKDGEVVCTLTFNSAGQLINIAFAPGRNGNHPAQYAEQVANGKGYRFTVTGLEESTHYTYNIDVKNTASQTINSHSGEFTTQSTTAVDNITTNNANIKKIMRNGQFIIIRNGVEYNTVGQEI